MKPETEMMIRVLHRLVPLTVIVLLVGCGGSVVVQEQGDQPPEAGMEDDGGGQDAGSDSDGSASGDEGGGELEPEERSPITNCDRIEPVYIPYVEDVVIPDTIIAGQPFEVTLRLSTALKPELLNGISREYALPREEYSGDTFIGLAIYLGDNPSEYEPVFEHTVEFFHVFVRDEKDTLRIQTADSPEWGGLEVMMNITQGYTHPHEHLIWREYPINVVPAEE